MASSVNSLLGSSAATAPNPGASSSTGLGGTVPSEGVFLQLLVSQLKNQDPLNPTDSTTFVTQLAQFSELEQVIGIKTDTDALAASAAASQPAAPATATTPTTTTSTTTNPTSTNPTATNPTTTN
jgi:flagellar basal-body rod modification protein FlgD